jgi:integrase
MQHQGTEPAKRLPEGIYPRHSRGCPASEGGSCSEGERGGCKPSYRAKVWDPRAKQSVFKSFSVSDYGTHAKAIKAADLWRAELRTAAKTRRVAASTLKLREAAEEFLAGAKAEPPTVLNRSGSPYKPSVLRGYEGDLEKHVLPDLGEHALARIERRDLKRLVTRLKGEGLSPSRIRNIINPVRAIYREAIEAQEVEIDPTAGLGLPAVPKPKERAVELSELLAFLAALPEDTRAIWATAAYAGLRLGELKGLRWSDVELRDVSPHVAGYLFVRRAVDGKAGLIEPKSESSRRPVFILKPYLSELLIAERERTGRGGDDYVFGQTASTWFKSGPDDRSRRALAKVNEQRAKDELDPIPFLTLHPMRHTFGAMARAAGIPADDIKDYLGHSRGSGVTVRYTSSIDSEWRDAENAQRLASFIGRGDTDARIAQLDGDALAAQLAEAEAMVLALRRQLNGEEA